ncbi:MAG: NAD-dependent epimerase/dehydratase family protein [Deltaproteobacteria bacterium]|nr:NAD-dependent epimerase/dehydratase family protein [Deltaproteobacteria bacterium]
MTRAKKSTRSVPAPPSPVLVTGAAGFIGRSLCRALIEAGCEVRGLDVPGADGGPLKAMGVELMRGDIREARELEAPLQGIRTVFHLAALAREWFPRETYMQINAEGTREMLMAAELAGVERFVHMSSLAIHLFDGHVDGDEQTPAANLEFGYCAGKLVAEHHVHAASRRGLQTTIIRPGGAIFGPGDTTTFVHLAPAIESGVLPMLGGGHQLMCYSYVENLVGGMVLAAAHPAGAGQTFILTDDLKITVREHAQAVADALGVRVRFIPVPVRAGEAAGWLLERSYELLGIAHAPVLTRYRVGIVVRDFHFSCAKAKRLLGYRPRIAYREGLRRTVDWYRSRAQSSRA